MIFVVPDCYNYGLMGRGEGCVITIYKKLNYIQVQHRNTCRPGAVVIQPINEAPGFKISLFADKIKSIAGGNKINEPFSKTL